MTPSLRKESELSRTEVARIPGTEARESAMRKNLAFVSMLSFMLLAAALTNYLVQAREQEKVPPRAVLEGLSKQLGSWREKETETLDARTLEVLKPDDYLQRTYLNDRGLPAFLFIGYFASQRSGSTYHSPQNCLPGAGWTMERRASVGVSAEPSAGQGLINQFIITKDNARMLTLYWYQGRGRTVASEYWGKIYTVKDAVTRQRTDGALVRVMLPISEGAGGEEAALKEGMDFVNQLLPELPRYIPD
jgi:EpsI family protein